MRLDMSTGRSDMNSVRVSKICAFVVSPVLLKSEKHFLSTKGDGNLLNTKEKKFYFAFFSSLLFFLYEMKVPQKLVDSKTYVELQVSVSH